MPDLGGGLRRAFYVERLAQWRVGLAARQFRAQRADYYDYLAELIASTSGAKTLLSIF